MHGSWDLNRLMNLADLHGTLDCLTSHLSVFTGLACRSFDGVQKKMRRDPVALMAVALSTISALQDSYLTEFNATLA